MIKDDLKKIMETSKSEVVRLFFTQTGMKEDFPVLEGELKKVLKQNGLSFSLNTLKAMKEGMDFFTSMSDLKDAKSISDAGLDKSYMALMFIEYLILLEEDKIKEAIDKNLK